MDRYRLISGHFMQVKEQSDGSTAQGNSLHILNLSGPQSSCNINVHPRQFLPRFSANELDSFPIRYQCTVNWKCFTQALHFLSDRDSWACSLDL